jgi:hypothetical protein
MSWIEKIQNKVTITTGDGEQYEPISRFERWSKSVEFNFTEYNFPNVAGSRVDRRLKKGERYDISLIFQGDDHLDVTESFLRSSENTQPWRINHPFFGVFACQPVSLEHDVSGFNTSVITGSVIETIVDDFPKLVENTESQISGLNDDFAESSDAVFTFAEFDSPDQILQQSNLDRVFANIKEKITLTDELNEYFQFFSEATDAVNNATAIPLLAIQTCRNVYTYPWRFAQNIQQRMQILLEQFGLLIAPIVSTISPNQKSIFENNIGLTISSMCMTAITPLESDYENAVDVLNVQNQIIDSFETFIESIDENQTPENDTSDSYVPNFENILNLYEIVSLTISKLGEIALDAKQERIITLQNDSNPVILTHRFYGLDNDDVNLNRFIETNGIGLSEIFELKKGRKIKYYI